MLLPTIAPQITVLVGLSVDYVVHLANSYIEAKDEKREQRVQEAFAEMGVTVFGGAVTSLGASAMLFLCYFQTFFKFGGFMFLTIMMSFVWSNLFFMSVLAVVGPNGNFCSFKPLIDRYDALQHAACLSSISNQRLTHGTAYSYWR